MPGTRACLGAGQSPEEEGGASGGGAEGEKRKGLGRVRHPLELTRGGLTCDLAHTVPGLGLENGVTELRVRVRVDEQEQERLIFPRGKGRPVCPALPKSPPAGRRLRIPRGPQNLASTRAQSQHRVPAHLLRSLGSECRGSGHCRGHKASSP